MIYIFKKRYFLIKKVSNEITSKTEISIDISIPIIPNDGTNINKRIILINEEIKTIDRASLSLLIL